MSKKKKDRIEEQLKKPKAAAKTKAEKKTGIVPASMPVLVPTATTTEAAVPPAESAPAPAPKVKKAPAKKAPAKKKAKAPNPAKTKPVEDVVVESVAAEEIVISNEDIALRAYFLSEARRARGQWGDETGDWIEAERQLRAEAAAKKK
jgi:hypothetical protein